MILLDRRRYLILPLRELALDYDIAIRFEDVGRRNNLTNILNQILEDLR